MTTMVGLLCEFKARNTEVDAAFKQISGQITQLESQVKGVNTSFTSMGTMGATALRTISGLIGGISVIGIAHEIASMAEEVHHLGTESQKLDLTVAQFQNLSIVAQEAGTSQESLSASIFKMNKTIGDAFLGTQKAVDSLKLLHLTADDFTGLDTQQRIILISKGLSVIGDVALRDAIGFQFLGKGAKEAMNFFSNDIEGGVASLEKLNYTLSQNQVAQLKQLTDESNRFYAVWKGKALQSLADAAPDIESVGSKLATVAGWAAKIANISLSGFSMAFKDLNNQLPSNSAWANLVGSQSFGMPSMPQLKPIQNGASGPQLGQIDYWNSNYPQSSIPSSSRGQSSNDYGAGLVSSLTSIKDAFDKQTLNTLNLQRASELATKSIKDMADGSVKAEIAFNKLNNTMDKADQKKTDEIEKNAALLSKPDNTFKDAWNARIGQQTIDQAKAQDALDDVGKSAGDATIGLNEFYATLQVNKDLKESKKDPGQTTFENALAQAIQKVEDIRNAASAPPVDRSYQINGKDVPFDSPEQKDTAKAIQDVVSGLRDLAGGNTAMQNVVKDFVSQQKNIDDIAKAKTELTNLKQDPAVLGNGDNLKAIDQILNSINSNTDPAPLLKQINDLSKGINDITGKPAQVQMEVTINPSPLFDATYKINGKDAFAHLQQEIDNLARQQGNRGF